MMFGGGFYFVHLYESIKDSSYQSVKL
ncbi:hypothetical protein SAMN05720606_1251 [Paenibacillus polysaccharolyticus]|uniref:Uncharacterized protein n=1 Tax=Paenibacillus polysaccharolyticus TaxID=582692 RepID=A0A1G5LFK8_9BACL|nr:hypothetical protein [Paenibacillus intestini]SCZ11261.1 hypothetical protein SAMN05720606_1251 [Paenibacillus polysaccharolyticus]